MLDIITLDREFALRLYFHAYQACRSVHKALGGPWPDFRAYFLPSSVGSLQETIDHLQEQCRMPMRFAARFRRRLASRLMPRWARWCTLTYLEGASLAFALESFVHVLGLLEQPGQHYLVSLRMVLFDGSYALEHRRGVRSLLHANEEIDHFYRADWITPISLEELLARGGFAEAGSARPHQRPKTSQTIPVDRR